MNRMRPNTFFFCILLIFITALSFPAPAFAKTGNDLVYEMREYEKSVIGKTAKYDDVNAYMSFVHGIWDSLVIDLRICPGKIETLSQACAIVSKYLKENPDQWNLSAYNLISNALFSKGYPECLSDDELKSRYIDLGFGDMLIIKMEIEKRGLSNKKQ